MKGRLRWFLVPAVLVAALLFVAPSSAEARRVVVRSYYYPYPCYGATYVYRYPRRVYYHYAPAPVVVYRRPAVFVGPPLPPPPPVYYGYYIW